MPGGAFTTNAHSGFRVVSQRVADLVEDGDVGVRAPRVADEVGSAEILPIDSLTAQSA